MPVIRSCAICKSSTGDVKHYGLRTDRKIDGRRVALSMGGIDLCDNCWETRCSHYLRGRPKK